MKTTLVIVATAAGSALLGAGITAVVMKKHYEEIIAYEIDTFKHDYIEKNDALLSAQLTALDNENLKSDHMAAQELIDQNGYVPAEIKESLEQHRNIFVDQPAEPLWDQFAEEAGRDENPYIISQREFSEGVYNRVELTYFQEDDVLVDSRDDIIGDPDEVLGEKALENFGHGSNETNVVYVRNDGLETDFHITQVPGAFEQEMTSHLQHADDRIKKFRTQDF